jgi:hypothetical protein
MPTVFTAFGMRVGFFSSDGTEPVHVHVVFGHEKAKFWIHGDDRRVTLASRSKGFRARDLARAHSLVEDNTVLIEEKWYAHFGR